MRGGGVGGGSGEEVVRKEGEDGTVEEVVDSLSLIERVVEG